MIRKTITMFLLTVMATNAHAIVTDGGIIRQNGQGVFMKLDTDVPFDVGNDNFDDDNLYAFDEDQNIILERPIQVDIGGENGFIPAETEVASHYVFFDSLSGIHIGFVDFDAPILGIAAFQDTMGATDFLANTSVNYIGTELRGLERGDQIWVDEDDPHRLWVYWAGSSPGDYVRVFTRRSIGGALM